jgi:predicted ATPase
LRAAEAAAQHVLARYDPQRHRRLVEIYQHDPKIVALIWSGHIQWILGRPQRARDCCEEARSYARALGHPFMLALALILGASDHLYQHDLAANLATVEEGIALAREHGFRIYEYFGPLWAIEAVAARGPTRLRLEDLTALVSRLLEKKCYLQAPLYQSWLAEAWAGIDEVERARALVAAAEALMLRTGERWFEPEVYRIRATLLSQGRRRSVSAARELFLRAIASARDLKAPGWELRAAIGLARLLDSEGDDAEAETLLAEVRSKFAAHERSTDLGAADALLQCLRSRLHERRGQVAVLP